MDLWFSVLENIWGKFQVCFHESWTSVFQHCSKITYVRTYLLSLLSLALLRYTNIIKPGKEKDTKTRVAPASVTAIRSVTVFQTELQKCQHISSEARAQRSHRYICQVGLAMTPDIPFHAILRHCWALISISDMRALTDPKEPGVSLLPHTCKEEEASKMYREATAASALIVLRLEEGVEKSRRQSGM